jgi:hypothetical protein
MTPLLRAALPLLILPLLAYEADAAEWNPPAWAEEDTIEIITVSAEDGPYEFPVWLVVLDGQLYLRLGGRAAERFKHNTTNPYVSVAIAGQQFPKVRVQEAPEMAQPVAAAMADKYFSDILIRYFDHPMTVRLVPEN